MRTVRWLLVALLMAGCATTTYDPAVSSWGYRVNIAGLGYLMKLFPNSHLCVENIAQDMARFNAFYNDPAKRFPRPGPCEQYTVRPVERAPDGSADWAFAIVGGGATWQTVAAEDEARCNAAREAWSTPVPLTKTPCQPLSVRPLEKRD